MASIGLKNYNNSVWYVWPIEYGKNNIFPEVGQVYRIEGENGITQVFKVIDCRGESNNDVIGNEIPTSRKTLVLVDFEWYLK